jgi:hypothetical protein
MKVSRTIVKKAAKLSKAAKSTKTAKPSKAGKSSNAGKSSDQVEFEIHIKKQHSIHSHLAYDSLRND